MLEGRPTDLILDPIQDQILDPIQDRQRAAGGRERRAWYDARPLMLRAALVGFGSSGKTTLFQLMTSAKETGRAAHGKGDVSIGISKVPDARLDRLTAMYNPRKRVPATVEFTDLAMPAGTGGAAALVDVVAYKNADALVHVARQCRTRAARSTPRATRRRWRTS